MKTRKRIHWLTTSLVTASLLAVISCDGGNGSSTPPPPPDVSGITSLAEVQAIFDASCLTACHEPGGIGFGETGLDLSPGVSYGHLFNQPSTASPGLLRVNSLDGENSVLYQRLTGAIQPQMPLPPNPPLPAASQALVKKWIDDGASTTGQLNSVLSGNQVSLASGGAIATAAGGSGAITMNADRTAIDFTLDVGAVADFTSPIIGAHIHAQDPGSDDGPIIFSFTLPAPLPETLVLSGTLTAADLIPGPNIPDFPAAVAALLNGTTYFQVHTEINPGGELRGHIGTETLTAGLDGNQVVPPVITAASGTGTVAINPDQDAVSVTLDLGAAAAYNGILTGAHIHAGAPDVNGPIIFAFALPEVIPANPVINVVLTAADLQPQESIVSFAEAVDALLSGMTYFQVHTTAHPAGEIRGQILPVR